jgi:hypothetical protein
MGNTTKSLLASLLFAFANMASAAGLYIDSSMYPNAQFPTGPHIGFNGYTSSATGVNGAMTGAYSKGTLGTLKTDTAGTVTATYLGDESGYDNFYRFYLSTAINNTLYEDSHSSPAGSVGTSISTTVAAGATIPFMYRDSQGVSVTNGLSFVGSDYATFAMLYKLDQFGGKVYTNSSNTLGKTFDFIIGFNDSAKVDADYDDFVVGMKFAPSPVPLPAAAWLFGSALFGFMMVSNRRKV